MSEFKFIHTADLHLDSPLKGLEQYEGAPVTEIREAARRALENLVELAIEQDVDFVLIAGDVYDGTWEDQNTVLFFVKQLTRLQAAGICVYAISGNHDAESKLKKWLKLPANPTGTNVMLSSKKPQTVLLEELGVAIHGRGFSKPAETTNLVLDYPFAVPGCFNIGLLHTALDGAADHAPYAPCSVADLEARQYQYWALGHVHNRRYVQAAGETPIVFPGNIQGRHIRETGAKGCELVHVDATGILTSQFVPLDVFRWEHCHVDATGLENASEVQDRVGEELQKLADDAKGLPLAVRVLLTGATMAHAELAADAAHWVQQFRIQAMTVSGSDVWLEKVVVRTTPQRTLSAEETESGPIAELLNYFSDLQNDEELLHEVSRELDDLHRKLPDELTRGNDSVIPTAPDQLQDILAEVRPMLLQRLMGQDGAENA